MGDLDELKQLAREHQQRIDLQSMPEAIVQESSDLPTNKVRAYRPDIRQSVVVNGLIRTPGVTVYLRMMPDKEWQIFAVGIGSSTPTFGEALGTVAQPPVNGELSGTVWGSKNLKMGLVRPWYEGGFGLFVFVEPFTHADKLITGTVGVSGSIPASTGERGLSVISYRVSTDEFLVTDGATSTLPPASWSVEDAVAIALPFTDCIRLGAVLLENGQVTIDQTTVFIDCRDWLTPEHDTVVIDAVDVTYTPTTSGDWTAPPSTVQEALDDLAAGVVGGSGTVAKRATMWHDESTVLAGAALTRNSLDLGQGYATRTFNSSPAINDAFTNSFVLVAGTYTFAVFGRGATDRAKVDWYIDGVLVVSAQDWYDASNLVAIKTASVTVLSTGYHVLKAIAASKNASSTNYQMMFTKFWLYPATD